MSDSAAACYPWLCIEQYLRDFVGARALSSAFELGLIDLLATQSAGIDALRERVPLDERGLRLLLAMLTANGVVDGGQADVALTPDFRRTLDYRDLMECRLYFAQLVAPDFLHLATALFADPDSFIRHAKLYDLFRYDRCFVRSRENMEATARWMRITTMLTRYEARAALDAFDFSGYRRQLDIGGNSGEFLLQTCRAHRELQGMVYDLPLVCEIGHAHLAPEPEAARIRFHAVRDREEPLPSGYDLISFKSMLHDWPDADVRAFLARAHAALEPGGSVLIFERARMEDVPWPLSYGQLPLMLFYRSYRDAGAYTALLEEAGFHDIALRTLALETPFHLISARKLHQHV